MRDTELMDVAERLAVEFGTLAARDVLDVVTRAAAEHPDVGPLFVEQAARARLAQRTKERGDL